MSMKVAVSTVACPVWDVRTWVAKAKMYGYQGIEIALKDGGHALLADSAGTRQVLEEAGLGVACIATTVRLHELSATAGQRAVDGGKRAIDLAKEVGAGVIRVWGFQMERGEIRAEVMARIGTRLREIAEYGQTASVDVALQNGGTFVYAKELLQIVELAAHPRAGVCWNMGTAAAVGEKPGLSVPTLGKKVFHAQVWDARPGDWIVPVTMGTGDVRNKGFVDRLREIKYERWISYVPPYRVPLTGPALEADLKVAAALLKDWIHESTGKDNGGKPEEKKTAEKKEVATEQ